MDECQDRREPSILANDTRQYRRGYVQDEPRSVRTMEMDRSAPKESLPYTSLKELYEGLNDRRQWPAVVPLRESTEYVFLGSQVSSEGSNLSKIPGDERPKTLVCHDMKGGYLDDRFINGTDSHDAYVFYYWSVVDTFVYFSHNFVTVPPYGWINAAHAHGVKVLGTVITEHTGGEKIWEAILESRESVRRFAGALVRVAKFYQFEGWLLNVENRIKSESVENLLYFVDYLTKDIHKEIEDSEIIWYDSVTDKGELKWQNELNERNEEFFKVCDGIFLNYNWTDETLTKSFDRASLIRRRAKNIYVGLDVWGRGCPGGGGFNSAYALDKVRKQGLSVAIFAPGWTHEYFQGEKFPVLEDMFWTELFSYLFVHVPIYDNETFRTTFCRGSGITYYRRGEHETLITRGNRNFERPFYNLCLQNIQMSVPVPHLKITKTKRETIPKSEENAMSRETIVCIYETENDVIRVCGKEVKFEQKSPVPNVNTFEFCDLFSYEGGGCLKLITKNSSQYHRLFLVHVEFDEDIQATIVYAPDSMRYSALDEPNLLLANESGTESFEPYETTRLAGRWRKCVYLTNMRTVNEIGVAFTKGESVCYLGEIVLERKDRRFDGANQRIQSVTRSGVSPSSS